MSFEWKCVKCEKIYPQDCEGAVFGGYFPFHPYVTVKCNCGGDLKIFYKTTATAKKIGVLFRTRKVTK